MLRDHAFVIACDEVGRGALAGPVAVGAAAVDARTARRRLPEGLRDSKLVPAGRRAAVAARVDEWASASSVGWASAAEIDEVGIMRALGLAAVRAVDDIASRLGIGADAVVLLDGNYDYLTPAGGSLRVVTVVKGDRDCGSAAAASVVAKVARDAHMGALHEDAPVYGWAQNKGYASPAHRAAIRDHGLSAHHRASWAIAAAPTLF